MEKRVFLAIFLSFGVLALYQAFLAPKPPPPSAATNATQPASTASTTGSTQPAPAASQAEAPGATPVVADTSARDIHVETDTVSAVLSTRGAILKSWRLKRYLTADQQPLELIPQEIPDQFPRPLTLATDDTAA